jgi:aryl-alcohol dehydrogenase-like predicted oxidoreductase
VKRILGRSGIEVSALGMGTWAIGGTQDGKDGRSYGWGPADDAESTRAIHRALDLGVTLFDTADAYGIGPAEEVLGRAVGSVRDQVVIATKWGTVFGDGLLAGRQDGSPGYVRTALVASLRRLGTDYVDLYQLHINGLPPVQAEDLVEVLEGLVGEGLIRWYGWSTDNVEGAAVFAKGEHCTAVQHEFNVFSDAADMLALCEAQDLASLNRSPLAMGLLSDKVTAESRYGSDTIRGSSPEWLRWFTDGRPDPAFLGRRDAIRDVLTSGGRTVAQGALAYCWARSDSTIPLPGCRTVEQVEQNAGAMRFGPLTSAELARIRSAIEV